jgi:8-hydroxy-5-deazaflavin:NADPH oxidoreductase
MKIAIIGGTGKLGLALAKRLHHSGHDVTIGSRDASRALEAARSIAESIRGNTNAAASEWCDAALVSVPYQGHRILLEPLRDVVRGKILIDATVPIDPANVLQIQTASGKSAAEETAALLPDTNVFAAFHTISHRVLGVLSSSHDVLVAGNAHRKSDVIELIRSMNLRPIDAGPIDVAGHLERMTVLLLSINRANKVKESGIKITGI